MRHNVITQAGGTISIRNRFSSFPFAKGRIDPLSIGNKHRSTCSMMQENQLDKSVSVGRLTKKFSHGGGEMILLPPPFDPGGGRPPPVNDIYALKKSVRPRTNRNAND